MASQSFMLKAAGLQTYYQSLMELSPGALLKANNTVINRDGVVEPRRGIKTYLPSISSNSGERVVKAKQLFEYRGNVFFHGNGPELDQDYMYSLVGGIYTPHTSIFAPVTGYRIRSEEAKGNFYFTSSTGIKTISSKTSSDFVSGFDIQETGGPKALPANASLNFTYVISGTGIGYLTGAVASIPAKSAYRILWTYTDNNDNLVFGAVSPRTIVSNPSTTTGISVNLSIPIPNVILNNSSQFKQYKYRIYRSEVANGEPSDELYQVFEGTLTSAQVSAELVTYTDSISDSARLGGVPLYTNQNSGEGILKSNESPPSARDLSLFKGHMFYANTRTAHSTSLTLQSTTNITTTSNIVITDGTGAGTSIYGFQGTKEASTLTVTTAVLANYVSKYLSISSGSNERRYALWFDTTGVAAVPSITSGLIPVKVTLLGLGTTALIAAAINTVLVSLSSDFTTSYTGGSSVISVTNSSNGSASDTTYVSGAEITVVKNTEGTGEVLSGTRKILISGRANTSEAIEETARSIVRVINSDPNCVVVASYISNFGETPGKLLLQKKNLVDLQFFLGTTDVNTASASTFSPKLGLGITNSSYTMGATSNITTSVAHGLNTSDVVCVYGATSLYLLATIDSSINGRAVVTGTPSAFIYSILNHSTGAWLSGVVPPASTVGTDGDNYIDTNTNIVYKKASGAWNTVTAVLNGTTIISPVESVAESIGNRIYYSKYQEHEAVPILNYIDVGSREQKILRIVKLRESLFILKEDGVFRLAGDPGSNPTWDVGAFDTTCIIKAPDTAVTLGNQCYFFSNQGVVSMNEAGLEVVSEPIQDKFLPFISTNPNLPTADFAVAYESDRALLLWTVSTKADTVATVCYRYSINTKTWTEWKIPKTCAVLNRAEDKLYFGSSIDNYIEVERKNFDRFDYTDRQFVITMATKGLNGTIIKTSGQPLMSVDDVILQEQYVTAYQFNTILKKLDLDSGIPASNFFTTLGFVSGDDMSSKLEELVNMLNIVDPASAYSFSGSTDFATIQVEFNQNIQKLNDSSVAVFTNYPMSVGTISYEAVIVSLDTVKKETTLDIAPAFMVGTMTLYKGIPTDISYTPQHVGDPSSEKQFSYGAFLFERRSFKSAQVGYNSDVSDSYEEIVISPVSSAIFGGVSWGDGSVWGGLGDQAELLTYIPLRKQRARFLGCRFTHATALESFALYGVSLTYRPYTIPNRTNR